MTERFFELDSDGLAFSFGGVEFYSINACPTHGGCSSLQFHFPRFRLSIWLDRDGIDLTWGQANHAMDQLLDGLLEVVDSGPGLGLMERLDEQPTEADLAELEAWLAMSELGTFERLD